MAQELPYAWVTEPVDWADGEEIMEMTYYMPPLTEEETIAFGSLKYYGYTAKLYYKGEPMDCQASPPVLFLLEQMKQSAPSGMPELYDGGLLPPCGCRPGLPIPTTPSCPLIPDCSMFDLPHNFGDYTLVALVGRTRGGILYQAIQQGMDRSVFMELLVPDNPEGVTVEDFIMKARTRAAINVPCWGRCTRLPRSRATGSLPASSWEAFFPPCWTAGKPCPSRIC